MRNAGWIGLRRRRRFSPATGALAALALVASFAGAASGAPVVINDVQLVGGGATWEVETAYTYGAGGAPCTSSDPGYTPVEHGSVDGFEDAFDGGLFLVVDGTTFDDLDGTGSLEEEGRELVVGPTRISRLRISRTERVFADGPTLRTLVRLANPTSRDLTVSIAWDSALGEDGTERTRASSAPALRATTADDDWIVTTGSTSPPDPAVTFVVYGPGDVDVSGRSVPAAPEDPDLTPDQPPDDGCVVFRFRVTVPSGRTSYLLFFTEMRTDAEDAADLAPRFEHLRASSPLLQGIRPKVAARILNWNL